MRSLLLNVIQSLLAIRGSIANVRGKFGSRQQSFRDRAIGMRRERGQAEGGARGPAGSRAGANHQAMIQ